MTLKAMAKQGLERNNELNEYLDFSDFDEFRSIVKRRISGVDVSKDLVSYSLGVFLFSTNIKGAISSKYGLNGISTSKVDMETKTDFEKIKQINGHLEQIKTLTKSLKSRAGNQFIAYTQFGLGNKRLSSHLDELSTAYKTAIRLSTGNADNRKTYYLALRDASKMVFITDPTMTNDHQWELFTLMATYCVFLIKKKLLSKDYGTFKSEFWDVKKGLEEALKIIKTEFLS